MRKIIVVGAGIGGLITASILSKNNFDVELIEEKDIDQVGYDWVDIFDIRPFDMLGIKLKNYEIVKNNITTIHSPSLKKSITTKSNSKRVRMNRKDLSKQLIDYAINCNVKITFNKKIEKLVIDNNKVVGVRIDDYEKYCDLVIDSSGVDSVLKSQASDIFGTDSTLKENQVFYTYRAFSYKKCNENNNIYLNEKGISWIIENKNYIDVLIGSTSILSDKELECEFNKLKKINNSIEHLSISNKYYKIPIRYPISKMIYNGYVLIGDSAYMTVPITGSGISLSVMGSKILSDVLIKKYNTNFLIEDLWDYQVEYFKSLAYSLGISDIFKNLLLNLNNKEIEFIFKNINGYTNVTFHPLKKLIIFIKNISNIKLIKILLNVLMSRSKIKNICKNIPSNYNEKEFEIWKIKYEDEFNK